MTYVEGILLTLACAVFWPVVIGWAVESAGGIRTLHPSFYKKEILK